MRNPSIIRQDVQTGNREIVSQVDAVRWISEFYFLDHFQILYMLQSGVIFEFGRYTYTYGYISQTIGEAMA